MTDEQNPPTVALPEVPSLPVVVVPPASAPPLPPDTTVEQDKRATGALAPTTTLEEDLKTQGQRAINRLWEVTQAIIAVVVSVGTLIVAGLLVMKGGEQAATAFLLLSNAFFMIVTAYFQRTNHTKTGGISGKYDR